MIYQANVVAPPKRLIVKNKTSEGPQVFIGSTWWTFRTAAFL